MKHNVSGDQKAAPSVPPLLVVIGAGAKAAALAAKARALKKCDKGEVRVLIVEGAKIAANWTGTTGFTSGQGTLGTPPEKDIGYPYRSEYGSEVDKALLRYSWHSYMVQLSETSYSGWLDRGMLRPKHIDWAHYLKWVIETVKAESEEEDGSAPQITVLEETEVKEIEPVGEKFRLTAYYKGKHAQHIEADGVVLTGPGEPLLVEKIISRRRGLIFDGRDYWRNIDNFRKMVSGNVAVIGDGEPAASVALSLVDLTLVPRGPSLEIAIINRHGAIFTRGESYNEQKYFSNPDDWAQLDEAMRDEFIERTDRGVFSSETQRRLDRAENVYTISGEVMAIEELGIDKVLLNLKREKPPLEWEMVYDRVIMTMGFDPWSMLKLFPPKFQPEFNTAAEREEIYKRLRRGVDRELRLPFDFVPEIAGQKLNVHMPMVAGLSQGPGFPNLSCLGHLSDRILSTYVSSSKR
jgi:mycobactin lysine-N-oxygenase